MSAILKRFVPEYADRAHWLDDFHADHAGTAAIVQRVLPFVIAQISKTPRLRACDTYLSTGARGPFIPDIYVDVTAQWARKLAAIRAHHSQRPEYWVALYRASMWVARAPLRPTRDPHRSAFMWRGLHGSFPLGFTAPTAVYLDT